MLIVMDITERILTEQMRRETYSQIEKNIEQFAVLGDHIRNPLQVIVGYAEMIDDPLVAKILDQSCRIDGIVTGLTGDGSSRRTSGGSCESTGTVRSLLCRRLSGSRPGRRLLILPGDKAVIFSPRMACTLFFDEVKKACRGFEPRKARLL